jgi:DNA invertase Pin-like site-specific DNA recombinase
MSYMAQKEREKIRVRQRQGINSAMEHGTKTGKPFGRPRAPIPDGFKVAYRAWKNAEITAVQAMKIANMKKTTFYRIVREWEEQQANEPTNRKAAKHQKA